MFLNPHKAGVRRSAWYVALLVVLAGATFLQAQPDVLQDWAKAVKLGDTFSVYSFGRSPYNRGAPFLTLEERQSFSDGAVAFDTAWSTGEGSFGISAINSRNAASCADCHVLDGRGRTHGTDINGSGFSIANHSGAGLRYFRYPVAGDPGAERLAGVDWQVAQRVKLPDEIVVELVAPVSQIGDGAKGVAVDLRNAPGVFGLGLIESIPDDAIVEHAAEGAFTGAGVRGSVQYSAVAGEEGRVARFGWKAGFATVDAQVRSAMMNELGLGAPPGPVPAAEIGALEALLSNYVRMLAVPVRRIADPQENLAGAALFESTGCAMCHRPGWVTGTGPDVPAILRGQHIYPFTDLLMHDMGPALAAPGAGSQSRQWRTPALWGIGAQSGVVPGVGYLHDGRARTLTEAILWHGGEGEHAVASFTRLGPDERRSLLNFLASL